MKLNEKTKILIVGLGLIGGSYADALSAAGFEVGAVEKRQASVDLALQKGWIRHGRTVAEPEYIGQFDLLVFALYPHTFLDWITENQQYIRPNALLTDVTGVKSCVVSPVQELLRADLEFIGAHPMAGREVSGVENASRELFRGANYIVTPTEKNTPEGIDTCRRLGELMGFGRISLLSPESHDEMIGFLSQLTHCIAVSLMTSKNAEHLAAYTGDSFRDLTRIAKINDEMWSELFLLNKAELLSQMELFEAQFTRLKNSIATGDIATMREMMRLSTRRRTYFDNEPKKENKQHEHGI